MSRRPILDVLGETEIALRRELRRLPVRPRDEMMPPRRPDPGPTFSIYPHQVHIGDRFTVANTEEDAKEWEVVSRPVTFKKGHEVPRARSARRSGDGAREVLGGPREDPGAP